MIRLIVVFAVAAVTLAGLGYAIGVDLALWKVHRYVDEVLISDPRQPAGIRLTTALMFAWPALAAGIACGVHRWRHGEDPSTRATILYFAIPAVLIAAFDLMEWWFSPVGATGGVRPMLTITTFAPGTREAQLAAFVAIVLWIYIGVRGRVR